MALVKLEAKVIEYIHDEMVPAFLAFEEAVSRRESRNHHLIESAAGRPFQTFGGLDLFPAIEQKAAALFHALTCNHCFVNGNKRTAVLALDIFLNLNGHVCLLNSAEVYELARQTAQANQQGRVLDDFMAELAETIGGGSIALSELNSHAVQELLGGEVAERLALAIRSMQGAYAVVADELYGKGRSDLATD